MHPPSPSSSRVRGTRALTLPPWGWLLLLTAACAEDPEARAPTLGVGDAGTDAALPDATQAPTTGSDASADAHAEHEPDLSAALYPPDRLMEVSIELSPEDFAALRKEGRSLSRVLSGCELISEYDYTKFHARVTVDGETREDVSVRKKGLLGSLSIPRPSLRVDFDEFVEDQELSSERTMTLNNSLQDHTYAHQCMAYALFEKAGIASPRCSFARVLVNREDLGTYVHVEAIKKPFLKRRFGTDKGDLYEGSAGDFTPDRIAYLEKKTHEDEPRSPEIDALMEAVTVPDEQLLARLAPLLDVDEFMRFWATEALVAEGDGYSSNQNNYFVYVHPDTRKIHFIPWGTDGALNAPETVNGPKGQPVSVYTKGVLCARLYAYAPTKEQYRQTLRGLIEANWNEAALDAEVTRIAALTHTDTLVKTLAAQRTFLAGRRAALLAELDGVAPVPTLTDPLPVMCYPERVRSVQGTFDLPMGTEEEPGLTLLTDSKVSLTLSKGPIEPLITSGFGTTTETTSLFALAITELSGSTVQVVIIMQRTDLAPGDVPFHGFETFGIVQSGPDAQHLTTEGFISDGVIHFDALTLGAGGVAKGRFDAQFVSMVP